MYKVMLVDDEKLILNGLQLLIDWKEIGLEVVSVAGNGEEALELFRQSPVDIVITDITMPKISGLVLIEKIKELNEDTRFIILSGYDDFNYAKQAIHLGIENYIIKPVNEEELTETLVATIKKLDTTERIPIVEGKKLELIRENILHRWVHNNISNYELEERNAILDINLSMELYCVGIIKLDADPCGELETRQNIYKTIKRRMDGLDSGEAFVDFESNLVCIIGTNNQEEHEKTCREFFENTLADIKYKHGVDAFAAIGECGSGYRNVSSSYESAEKLRKYLLVMGYNNVVDRSADNPSKQRHEGIIDAAEFQRVLMTKDRGQILAYVECLLENMCAYSDVSPEEIHNLAVKIILVLNELSAELGFSEKYTEGCIKENIINICETDTIDKLKLVLQKRVDEFVDGCAEDMEVKSPIIKRITALIKENYNSELSLKTLGQKFNVNPSYLGQIFYKETGEQFSEYLNRIRNEHARSLLLNTDQRIHEIAKCVGYTDNSYFYKKFKEVYGVSPNTLRSSRNYN